MIPVRFPVVLGFTHSVSPLRAGLHGFRDAWLRFNSLEWNNHYSGLPALHPTGQLKLFKSLQAIESASLCMALRPKNRTLQPVQLRFLGLLPNYKSLHRGIVPVPHPCSNPDLRYYHHAAHSTAAMIYRAGTALRYLALLALLLTCMPAIADTETTAAKLPHAPAQSRVQSAVDNLAILQQSIELKQDALRELQKKLKKTVDATGKQEIEQQITRIRSDISNLQAAFENIALGGIDIADFEEKPEEKVDWRAELEQISKPLLSTLKQITAKPRQMDSLQREIGRYEDQLKEIDRAIQSIKSIQSFSSEGLPKVTAEPLTQLLSNWQQRRVDVQRAHGTGAIQAQQPEHRNDVLA